MFPQSIGFGSCVGGERPDPPIDDYPLLVWVDGVVGLEDGKASVQRVIDLMPSAMPVHEMARHLGTTRQHIDQAIAYARKAGLI